MEKFFIENSNFTLALVSTALIVVSIYLVGFILDCITQAFAQIIMGFLGYDVTMFIMNNLTFVGTVHHELSHALFAFLTGAKISEIKLYNPENGVLGSVSYYPKGNVFFQCIQCTLSSIAPVICGFFTLSLLSNNYNTLTGIGIPNWLLIYLMISIFSHMTMSSQDIKVSLKGLLAFILVLFVIMYVTRFDYGKFASNFLLEVFYFLKKLYNGEKI